MKERLEQLKKAITQDFPDLVLEPETAQWAYIQHIDQIITDLDIALSHMHSAKSYLE